MFKMCSIGLAAYAREGLVVRLFGSAQSLLKPVHISIWHSAPHFVESLFMFFCYGNAEASCVSQILTAQAVAADMGEGRAASCGVDTWASCHLRNSERDVQRTLKKQKSKLDIPVSSINCSGCKVPWISPESWLKFIVKKGLWPLMAGCDAHDYDGAERNWLQFWKTYQQIHPDFGLFQMENVDLSRTAAWLIHGDEGRTLKRNGLMVTSVQSALGRGFDEKRVHGQAADSAKLRVNFAGHSFLTRYVVNTMPKTAYESNPKVFHEAMDHISASLNRCLREGFLDASRGEKFHVVVLGVKGDTPYLAKVGNFYRTYNTTAKRGEERGPPKGTCPYCLAGTREFPGEEIATTKPKWLLTMGVKLPWVECPTVIKNLVHDYGNPAGFFKSDIWHVVHLGFGRSWVASTVQLVLQHLPCSNLDEKWEYLTEDYLCWCHDNKKQAHISKISPYLMSYGDHGGAMGNWHKGALTTNFLQWLVVLLGKVAPDPLLLRCRTATYRLNAMFSLLYRAGAFLTENEAAFASEQGLQFLRAYASLAESMYMESKQWLWPLYPKLHVFHHIMLEMHYTGTRVKTCPNPMLFACQIDEDVVGKASRLSRKVNIRLVAQRALERYLTAAYTAFAKAKLLQ